MCQMTCRVDSLKAGTVVQFNVIATNSVGDSKPSETSPMYYVIGDSLQSYIVHYYSDGQMTRPPWPAQEALVPGVHGCELHS